MSATVIILLIGLWAAVLMPGLVRARREGSPATSVSRFNRSMDLLERTRLDPPIRLAEDAIFDSGEEEPSMGQAVQSGRAAGARYHAGRRRPAWHGGAERLMRARPRRSRRWGSQRGARRLAPPPPPPPTAAEPRPHSGDVVARRRAVLSVLAGLTLLGAVLTPLARLGLALLLLGLAATGTYLALLWQLQRQRELRRRVRHLDPAPAGEPAPEQPPARAVGDPVGG